ncbi:MAG: hypothetical protein QOD36_1537 [Mycobacterium sp.]|nr:hypothetical protein [Mycobacterium sp.]
MPRTARRPQATRPTHRNHRQPQRTHQRSPDERLARRSPRTANKPRCSGQENRHPRSQHETRPWIHCRRRNAADMSNSLRTIGGARKPATVGVLRLLRMLDLRGPQHRADPGRPGIHLPQRSFRRPRYKRGRESGRLGPTTSRILTRSPDPKQRGLATNARRRDGSDQHSVRAGETSPKDAVGSFDEPALLEPGTGKPLRSQPAGDRHITSHTRSPPRKSWLQTTRSYPKFNKMDVFQTCAVPSVGEDPIDNRRRLVLAA